MRTATRARSGGASIRISYRRALDAVTQPIAELGHDETVAHAYAASALRPLLTDRQKKVLKT